MSKAIIITIVFGATVFNLREQFFLITPLYEQWSHSYSYSSGEKKEVRYHDLLLFYPDRFFFFFKPLYMRSHLFIFQIKNLLSRETVSGPPPLLLAKPSERGGAVQRRCRRPFPWVLICYRNYKNIYISIQYIKKIFFFGSNSGPP